MKPEEENKIINKLIEHANQLETERKNAKTLRIKENEKRNPPILNAYSQVQKNANHVQIIPPSPKEKIELISPEPGKLKEAIKKLKTNEIQKDLRNKNTSFIKKTILPLLDRPQLLMIKAILEDAREIKNKKKSKKKAQARLEVSDEDWKLLVNEIKQMDPKTVLSQITQSLKTINDEIKLNFKPKRFK